MTYIDAIRREAYPLSQSLFEFSPGLGNLLEVVLQYVDLFLRETRSTFLCILDILGILLWETSKWTELRVEVEVREEVVGGEVSVMWWVW